MKYFSFLSLIGFSLLCGTILAQEAIPDSQGVKILEGVMVKAYSGDLNSLNVPGAVFILDSTRMRMRLGSELLPVLNTVPGVRMEERSPGSYRLSIRGSLLRSPFGVRNVKIYLDEYPFTDAGGNSYLNTLNVTDDGRIEVIKGPDGSLFGANTGGVVHIFPARSPESPRLKASIAGGSYGLFAEQVSGSIRAGKHQLSIQQSYQRSDGYRKNSAMHRACLSLADQWSYSKKGTLKVLLLASDLYYQTPGGLTLSQMEEDPRMARPAAGMNPGAAEQKAAVYTKLVFGGIHHRLAIHNRIEHHIALSGSLVDFRNPFITNYETRDEKTYGLRSYLIWRDGNLHPATLTWNWQTGLEWQQTISDIHNYDNNKGVKGDLQTAGTILSDQHFFFSRFQSTLHKKLIVEGSLSLVDGAYRFKDDILLKSEFASQWMPRFALSYMLSNEMVLRGTISRGYSPPTISEVRPSNNLIYTDLNAEHGWNYELGFRYKSANRHWQADVSVFYFKLKDAIVRNVDRNGAEFFSNAGGTKQVGVESYIVYNLISKNDHSFITGLSVFNSATYNHFRFGDYKSGGEDYSGNKLTGVPELVNVAGIQLSTRHGVYLNTNYNYTGRIVLNDGNSMFTKSYNLIQMKIGKSLFYSRINTLIEMGIDNLLNEEYSLGNDINAFGARYYNPATKRNFIVSVKTLIN